MRAKLNTENEDAPNPLFNTGNCEDEFFRFSDLMSPPFLQGNFLFKNPCDTSQLIPENIPTFFHQRPVMAYRNEDDNTFPDVVFPEFDVNNVVPVPAKQMLHQNQRLIEEIGKENEREVLVHLLDGLLHVSLVVGAVHVESKRPGLERKRGV